MRGLIFGPGQVWRYLLAFSSSKHCKAGSPGVTAVRMKSLQFEFTSSPKSCELWLLSDGKQTYHVYQGYFLEDLENIGNVA